MHHHLSNQFILLERLIHFDFPIKTGFNREGPMEVDVLEWNDLKHSSRFVTGHSADVIINQTFPIQPETTPAVMNYSLIETVLISAALLAIIVGTVVGNVLVCIAVCLVRRL
ncbi:hypothetical protein GHT06_021088 [Daphnia sinensis]|uniref:Uncharacterized protein n=1 Tax=Daphnia sinensis TaxID=1820382 RepID=A0AAD5KJA7_9CRUS|nr:hypothetical protein GHT06_021088 [Daphnia sinensis]